ncbi:hypothetical protein PDIG_36330 [Penicillium digitatum PHI26]|uniref:Uncharacterized protein n=2 Tax=Penicillium digitatum TaxID=36651 RepID=K9FYQ5_PEND2|nr:hypothetical protein PDIP_05160 [Penicillium digitatum Pd1]EKV13722.1 hypothetical protein PDIG_36330 [Penicillium digitatum PHI26]EKV21571.1 hypothetical protein PDIP_05160 [Penicillium digitatum Pd1]
MEGEEDLIKCLSVESSAQAPAVKVFRYYLTVEEATQIIHQFRSGSWNKDRQVLWSGMMREDAQKWADEHEMQTLTTAMGPLMMPENPLCLKSKKTSHAWSQYIYTVPRPFLLGIFPMAEVLQSCRLLPQTVSIHRVLRLSR